MLSLPPVPAGIQMLRLGGAEERLLRQYPDLPMDLKQCPTCSGKEHFRWKGPDGQPADFECDCIGQVMMNRWFLHCGIDLSYQRLGWDDLTGTDEGAQEECLAYAANVVENVAAGQGMIPWRADTGPG